MPDTAPFRYEPLEPARAVLVRGCLGCLGDALVLYRVVLRRTWLTTLCAACAATHQRTHAVQGSLWLATGAGEDAP